MPNSYRPSIRGKRSMVSSLHYLASMAGMRILEQGGNAADAGVAAGISINVLQPEWANFGGVAPIIYGPGNGAPVETISGLGRWPRAANLEDYVARYGGDIPAGIPRTVTPAAPDAWLTALARYGSMTFEEVVQPALDLAENGRPVDAAWHNALASGRLRGWPTNAAIFYPQDRVPNVGELFYQKDLANTFRRMIAAEHTAGAGRNGTNGAGREARRKAGIRAARDLIYKGEIAREIADFHQQQGSLLTYEDLANFSVRVEPPEQIGYGDYAVYSCGPWCQGPSMLIALNILAGYDLHAMGHNSASYLHTLIESIKLAFADRHAYFGDPDFVQVPMAGLLHTDYASERRKVIDPQHAAPDMPAAGNPWPYNGEKRRGNGPVAWVETQDVPAERASVWESDTSYICVVDADGNQFSATPSDGVSGGPVVPGLGFVISPRGTQTWLDPDHPCALQPWKRPRLTPNPALALKQGKPFMPFGCPGGDAQVQGMLQVFLNVVEWDMEPQEAIEAPRIVSHSFPNSFWPHQSRPGEVEIETRIDGRTRDDLRARGHIVQDEHAWSPNVSRVCAITIDSESGVRTGGADPRSTSYVIGW